jgi:hypothetical protein
MKLEKTNTARFITRVPVVVVSKNKKNIISALVFSGSKIHTIREDTANNAHLQKMRKLANRKINEQWGKCAVWHEGFYAYSDIAPDHRNPKGIARFG